jgi:chromosomal replication initiation ATPase DnaA
MHGVLVPSFGFLVEGVHAALAFDPFADLFNSWFVEVEWEDIVKNSPVLSVPTKFLKSWISNHFTDRIVAALNNMRVQNPKWPELSGLTITVRPKPR